MLVTFYHLEPNFLKVLSKKFKTSPLQSFLLEGLKRFDFKAYLLIIQIH